MVILDNDCQSKFREHFVRSWGLGGPKWRGRAPFGTLDANYFADGAKQQLPASFGQTGFAHMYERRNKLI